MMKIKFVLPFVFLAFAIQSSAQNPKVPVTINLKDGKSVEAIHFGQLKCGKETYSNNYMIIRGKYMGAVTEMKDFKEFDKIVLEGYTAPPAASVGNEKGTLVIYKKNGVSVTLEDAEMVMSCYGHGDMYNVLVVQILNPLTNQPSEQAVETQNIQSIVFK
jgi:hypothetical protein